METFTVRDLRERTGELIRSAEAGKLSVITKHGAPVFIAVPFDDLLIKEGVGAALVIHLFDEEQISLGMAARMINCTVAEMIQLLNRHGIPIVRTTPAELERELADFG